MLLSSSYSPTFSAFWQDPSICLSFHFHFHLVYFLFSRCFCLLFSCLLILSTMLLVTISLSLFYFCIYFNYLNCCFYAVLHSDEASSSSFFLTHGLSMRFLRCKALYIVINFFVLSSICLTSSLVYLNNGSEYLTRKTYYFYYHGFFFLHLSIFMIVVFNMVFQSTCFLACTTNAT